MQKKKNDDFNLTTEAAEFFAEVSELHFCNFARYKNSVHIFAQNSAASVVNFYGVSAGACAASVTSRNLLKNEFFFTSVDTI